MEIAGLCGLGGLLLWHIYAVGKASGAQAARAQQVSADAKVFEQTVAQYRASLSEATQTEHEAGQLASRAQAAATAAANALAAAQASRQSDKNRVGELAPSDVEEDLETKLGGPLAEYSILRKDDLIVTDYPHLQTETEQISQQVDALHKQLMAQADEMDAITKQRDSAMGAYNSAARLYIQAFNAIPRHRSVAGQICGILTLYRACRPAHMRLPAPISMRKP